MPMVLLELAAGNTVLTSHGLALVKARAAYTRSATELTGISAWPRPLRRSGGRRSPVASAWGAVMASAATVA